jgi:hypothetical protein
MSRRVRSLARSSISGGTHGQRNQRSRGHRSQSREGGAACRRRAIGALGAIILVIVNATISVANKTGVFGVHTTHGWIGLLAFAVGLIGALTTLFKPTWGALLMVVAGLGFIYVAGAGAILATPFLLIAGGLAYIDRPKPAK